jgi:hypothetical protein
VIRLIGALIDLLLRLWPTAKEQKESEIRKKRDQNAKRIDSFFSGNGGTSWWMR